MNTLTNNIILGCGLIRIGRTWGFKSSKPPNSSDANLFLHFAINQGITFFDTAPAYGSSEKRLGDFLKGLSSDVKEKLVIATKCGETWNEAKQATDVDHSFATLSRSIDRSLKLLGKINILQIHKATPKILNSSEVNAALEYAKTKGIKLFGASVSDMETVDEVLGMEHISVVQLPYNPERKELEGAIQKLNKAKKFIIINRPFNMGAFLYHNLDNESKQQLLTEAYSFILQEEFNGVILTGTANKTHLKENIEAFSKAKFNNF